jgi:hypothetical protein
MAAHDSNLNVYLESESIVALAEDLAAVFAEPPVCLLKLFLPPWMLC